MLVVSLDAFNKVQRECLVVLPITSGGGKSFKPARRVFAVSFEADAAHAIQPQQRALRSTARSGLAGTFRQMPGLNRFRLQ